MFPALHHLTLPTLTRMVTEKAFWSVETIISPSSLCSHQAVRPRGGRSLQDKDCCDQPGRLCAVVARADCELAWPGSACTHSCTPCTLAGALLTFPAQIITPGSYNCSPPAPRRSLLAAQLLQCEPVSAVPACLCCSVSLSLLQWEPVSLLPGRPYRITPEFLFCFPDLPSPPPGFASHHTTPRFGPTRTANR